MPRQQTVTRMADAATALLESLTPQQRSQALFDFGDETVRKDWHYVPRDRAGLSLKEMDESQRTLVLALVGTGLSVDAHQRVQTIMQLESVLAELEGSDRTHPREPELYYISLFGDAQGDAPWGWRFEGHHISLNNTIVDGTGLSTAPLFLGANPAQVRHGESAGLRALKEEEDLARELLHDLDGEQKRAAIVSHEAPPDIITRNVPHVRGEVHAEGLAMVAMTPGQRELLAALVRVYVERLPEEQAEAELARIGRFTHTHFAWAGSEECGSPHYYRVQDPAFVAEYDNTQNNANHIHAVWRDLNNDFGEDMLRRHYGEGHRNGLGH
ncbi:MAG: DUF3500 domain-containing protein [Candidatus Latescibacterota bacterium]|nr:DUF3500 domain-containing protein [Candidatus Latescibacterota bacterium]